MSWQETLGVDINSDPHISGKYGFTLWTEPGEANLFESEMAYSSFDDAKQAGEDAAHAAWLYRNWRGG